MALKPGSMREAINNIYQKLIKNETLLRLLYYPPMSARNPDPLSDQLSNLVNPESEEYWNLVDDRIMLAEKTSDLEDRPLCRLYVYAGRRRPVFNNYQLATQEVIINVFTHEYFEKDMRSVWISDVLNEILTLKRISGFGQLEYAGGNPLVAPAGYKQYQHIYRYSDSKK
ncbi:hypothetical protein [Siminovitchia sp. 179-K 8D1 HS]|uniref:hypothetical protein n=1 Tax=Siminovitchia sp. 179-K 8D1 HS TaxID=3142385 RepID=UPI0039A3379C